jgi:hypothetical protein
MLCRHHTCWRSYDTERMQRYNVHCSTYYEPQHVVRKDTTPCKRQWRRHARMSSREEPSPHFSATCAPAYNVVNATVYHTALYYTVAWQQPVRVRSRVEGVEYMLAVGNVANAIDEQFQPSHTAVRQHDSSAENKAFICKETNNKRRRRARARRSGKACQHL